MTPLVAAAKFHGKAGGVGGSLSVSTGVSQSFWLYWHGLNSRDGGKWTLAAKSVQCLPVAPTPPSPVEGRCPHWMPLYRQRAILTFQKYCVGLVSRCLWPAASAALPRVLASKPTQRPEKNVSTGHPRRLAPPPSVSEPQATGYPGDETASVLGTVQEATRSYFQVSQGHSLVT